MKKRYASFLLIFIMLAGVLSACAINVHPTPSSTPTSSPATNTVSESLSAPSPAPVDEEMAETILSFGISFFIDKEYEPEKLRDIVRASFDDKEKMGSFVTEYLEERGMYKPTPDAAYDYGYYYAEYYMNEENKKTSFILHEDDDFGWYFVYCISFSWDDLSEIGSIVYKCDENRNTVFEGVYLPDGPCAAYASYEYFDGVPFPFVENYYIEYTELEDGDLYRDVFHMNNRFWLDKKFAVIDETGRVTGYNADLYDWWSSLSGTVCNNFVYDEKGMLIAIYEELTEKDDLNTWHGEYATDITLEYRDDDTLSTVDYAFSYMNNDTHNRGSGESNGKIFYDAQGRMVYRYYYMTHGYHSCFYLYEGDSKTPWAYIEAGGIAYSGDDVSEYGFGLSVYLFQPAADEVQNAGNLWQDAYAGFLRENIPVNGVDFDTFADGSDEQTRLTAFSAGGYPVTPFFYLYDIDKDGTPELIYI